MASIRKQLRHSLVVARSPTIDLSHDASGQCRSWQKRAGPLQWIKRTRDTSQDRFFSFAVAATPVRKSEALGFLPRAFACALWEEPGANGYSAEWASQGAGASGQVAKESKRATMHSNFQRPEPFTASLCPPPRRKWFFIEAGSWPSGHQSLVQTRLKTHAPCLQLLKFVQAKHMVPLLLP